MLTSGPSRAGLPLSDRLTELFLGGRRAVLARRRPLAFVLVAVAVLSGLRATASPTPPDVAVTVAAHDLAAGAPLAAGDVRTVRFAAGTAPHGRVRDPTGRVLAAPLRAGEPVTDARLVGPALTAGRPGLVTVPVRFPDAGMVALLRVGDTLDVLAADPQGGDPSVLARDCPVLALPAADATTPAETVAQAGRLVVLGVPETALTAVSGASVTRYLSFAFAR